MCGFDTRPEAGTNGRSMKIFSFQGDALAIRNSDLYTLVVWIREVDRHMREFHGTYWVE